MIIMENQLSYVVMLSLKEIALRRVAVVIWNTPDILASIEKISDKSFYIYESDWHKTVESKVIDKISKLLPKLLTKQMLLLVNPVGLQIRSWVQFHKHYLKCSLGVPILKKLHWNTTGTIDCRKTAEELLRFKMLDMVKHYQLACLYCLDDYIPSFWRELPEEIKSTFYNEDASPVELQYCWPYILEGEHSKLNDKCTQYYFRPVTFTGHAFESSIEKGNKAAAQFFFKKLTEEEREASLFSATSRVCGQYILTDEFPPENVSHTFSYLLSLMNHKQQMQVFQDFPFSVLQCFLEWPWQDVLFEIADRIWDFLSADNYVSLLLKMAKRFKKSDYYFPKLFQEFFLHSPVNFRKEFVDQECQSGHFFQEFFHSLVSEFNYSETIEVIFRNVDAADRVRLVSSDSIFNVFHISIMCRKWDWVQKCLQEARLSKEDRDTVKEAFTGFLTRIDNLQIQFPKLIWSNPEWETGVFFHLLDETVQT